MSSAKPLVVLSLFTLAGLTRAGMDIIPKPFNTDRYRETLAASPFVVETKVAEDKPIEKKDVFKDLFIRGVSKADGKDYVVVQRLGDDKPMRFLGDEPADKHDGLTLKSARVGANFRETKVVLQMGTETGEIGFKEDSITAPPAAQVRPPGAPGQVNRPGVPAPAAMPGAVRVPQPNAVPPIQRPQMPTAVHAPNPARSVPSSQSATDAARRTRVRVINN